MILSFSWLLAFDQSVEKSKYALTPNEGEGGRKQHLKEYLCGIQGLLLHEKGGSRDMLVSVPAYADGQDALWL